MTPYKGWSVELTLLLLHSSWGALLDASTDNLSFRPLRRNADIQPTTHDQTHRHRAKTMDHIIGGESPTPTLQHLYLDGEFIYMTEPHLGHFLADHQEDDMDDSYFEDRKKHTMRRNNPINGQENGVAKEIHKYSNAKSESIFLKDPRTNSEKMFLNDMEAKSESTLRDGDDVPPAKSVSDVFKNGGWAMAKSRILETVNTISHQDESSILEDMKVYLDIGDKIYFAQSFVEKLEPSLSHFLYDYIDAPMIFLTNILKYIGFSSNGIDDWRNVERLFASKNVQVLITMAQNIMKDHLSLNGLKKYYTLLLENNPMAAQALDFVLNLFPDASQGEMGRSFYTEEMHDSYEQVDTKVDRHDDHYGGHGSYDSGYGHSGGGYGHEMSHHHSYHQIDPYLLLAGLGAATLLSYIAYLVLTTTTAALVGRKKKRSLDFPGNLDLSDLPEVHYSINNMIEIAEEKFGGEEEDPMEDLSSSLNSLWNTRQEAGCVRCVLMDRVKGGLDCLSLQHLFMSAIAQLMGAERVGHLLDELLAPVTTHLLDRGA